MTASVSEKQFYTRIVDNSGYFCRYMLRDYGDYRTITKICFIDGKWDTASRVNEYIYWRNPLARNV